ncbi:MAG: hypothetical protein HQ502_06140, partial [Alphaproteobacteria bacterium]|nr:hypothetical protein [Alphaproteobacteria bacterium]
IAFDLTGSYQNTLLLLAIYPAGCAIAAIFLRTPPQLLARQGNVDQT